MPKRKSEIPAYVNTNLQDEKDLAEWMIEHKKRTKISFQGQVVLGLQLYREQQIELERIKSGATQMTAAAQQAASGV